MGESGTQLKTRIRVYFSHWRSNAGYRDRAPQRRDPRNGVNHRCPEVTGLAFYLTGLAFDLTDLAFDVMDLAFDLVGLAFDFGVPRFLRG
jgi:hypothetical protein